jgi:hypothetical protein
MKQIFAAQVRVVQPMVGADSLHFHVDCYGKGSSGG